MSGPRRTPRTLLVAAALASVAAAAAGDWSLRPVALSACETTLVDAGRPEARWALGDGVYGDERDRSGRDWTWTPREWRARLLLAEGGERTLRLIGHRAPPRLALQAWWNGADLGRREVGEGRVTVSWQVPAGLARPGVNRLRFTASAAAERPGRRQLSFRLDRLELGPSPAACEPVRRTTAGERLRLPAGGIALVWAPLPPAAEMELELEGPPGGVVELHLARHGKLQRSLQLATTGRPGIERLALGDLVSDELALVARGPGVATVRLLEITGAERPAAWRRACGLIWKVPLVGAGLLGLLVLLVAAGRLLPGGRAAAWVDCGLLLILALGLRFAFLEAYPAVDPHRFGDSWEYLQRSRHLLQGASFWGDTGWHAWLSWIRPPGYYLLLAGVLGPLGGGLDRLAEIQTVLLAATAVAGYQIAYPLFGRGAALVAGLLLAVYPQTITSATWILSDPLSLFLTTSALACLSWLSVRPAYAPALVAGGLFGLACLVRSAPLYFVPLAALLLFLGQRRPRRAGPALALAGAALLVILPWCVRNSLIYGKVMGIDDLVIPNFLMAHPDPELTPAELVDSGVWEEADERREAYFRALWRANQGARLTLQSGRILGRGLLRMAASPGTTARRFALHLKIYFQPFGRSYAAHFLLDPDGCRISWWTEWLNLVYLVTVVLAAAGGLLALRRRASWPLLAWVLYFVIVTNLFFYPSYMPGRYRLPIYPALAALAGLALSRGEELLATRRRRPGSGA